jgi:hypothetical protein
MAIPYNPQFGFDPFLEGYVEGVAEVMLRVLERRGIELSQAQREQIIECTDLDLLDTWIDQGLDATCRSDLASLDDDASGDDDTAPDPVVSQAP